MEPVLRINPHMTVKQFTPIVWKVKFGDWNINYIWQYLYQHDKLEWFNSLSDDDQLGFLMDEFVRN